MANEIPFVGDDPVSIQEKAEKVDFLKDHWPYNLADLIRILDLCFNWKSQVRIPEQKYLLCLKILTLLVQLGWVFILTHL